MSSPDDFDTGNLDASTEEAPAETPLEASAEPLIEVEGHSEVAESIDEAFDGPSPETNENQEHEDEVLGDIVDPRLTTVEGSDGVDASIPDPRLISEASVEPEPIVVGPTVEELQAELAAAIEARDFAHGLYQGALTRAQNAESAGERLSMSLADEMNHRIAAESALHSTQASLLEASMKASNLAAELETAQTTLLERERDFAALNARSIFQIIPTFKQGQKRETRIYILADDAGDAIRRAEKAGVVTSGEVENITRTSQKLVII